MTPRHSWREVEPGELREYATASNLDRDRCRRCDLYRFAARGERPPLSWYEEVATPPAGPSRRVRRWEHAPSCPPPPPRLPEDAPSGQLPLPWIAAPPSGATHRSED